jgi:hypothetical protein
MLKRLRVKRLKLTEIGKYKEFGMWDWVSG